MSKIYNYLQLNYCDYIFEMSLCDWLYIIVIIEINLSNRGKFDWILLDKSLFSINYNTHTGRHNNLE